MRDVEPLKPLEQRTVLQNIGTGVNVFGSYKERAHQALMFIVYYLCCRANFLEADVKATLANRNQGKSEMREMLK